MAASEHEPHVQDQLALRRQLTAEARAWFRRAWRMKIQLARYATKVRRTGVRTSADAELMSLANYRLAEAIYEFKLVKQALIRLYPQDR